jgi:tetratricopeptide (TPR) repeat protein
MLEAEKGLATSELRKVLVAIGEELRIKANYPKALVAFEVSKRVAERTGDMQGVAVALNELGRVHMLQGNLNGSLDSYQKALALCEQLGEKDCTAIALAGVGSAYSGKGDNSSPMYSHVVLAQSEDGKEDGLLEAWEIMQMDLKADLAVLSACETARGRIEAGEGVIGLAWALFVAGCPTTVVSQWKVESSSTTELMLAFHRNLQTGATTSESMCRAAMKLMSDKRYNHPFYWAGFIVIGDVR